MTAAKVGGESFGAHRVYDGSIDALGGSGAQNAGQNGTKVFILYVPPPEGTLILLQ